ncbi:hypothetical protein M405DRAFT_835415, partial [Rhizopogon salebrosus TDB-379]
MYYHDIFKLIATRSSPAFQSPQRPRSPVLLRGFAYRHQICKGWSGTSLLPSFNAGEQPRGQMWRYESSKAPTVSGGLVPADMATRTLLRSSAHETLGFI